MSRNLKLGVGLVLLVCGFSAGCTKSTTRLNAPPQGYADQRSDLQPFFTRMTDNALLADMSISDIHFVAHTTELNSLGADRLTRMAQLMETYGGTVRYATRNQNEEMVNQRIAHVKEYLAAAGADMNRVDVQQGMAGSSDTPAEQAIAAREKGWDSDLSGAQEGQEGF